MNATIKDIAQDTNLSPATISKYLNGKKILPENQSTIENSIKKLNYIPNKNAQMLRSRKANVITILTPVIGDYFWGSIINYVEEYMQKHNYSTIISSYDPLKSDYSEVYQQLISTQTEGVILVPPNQNKINILHFLQKANIPFVYLDQVLTVSAADYVTSNNRTSAYDITCYLIRNGHRKIGVIGGPVDSYTSNERIHGFRQACFEHDIPKKDQFIFRGNYDVLSAVASFRKMIAAPEKPTAVFMLGYHYTVAIIQLLHELNLQIPEDLSIVSFDDDQLFTAVEPSITVMAQDLPKMGKEAARLLLKRIQGDRTDFPRTVYIDTLFIERNSVKKRTK